MQKRRKPEVLSSGFFFSIETDAYRFSDMDFTVAAPLGALGWEPSPELDRGESSTNLTVVPKSGGRSKYKTLREKNKFFFFVNFKK